MRTKPVVLSVPVRADALLGPAGARKRAATVALDRQVRRALRDPATSKQTEGLRAAVVLAFGQTGQNIEKGQRLARAVIKELPGIDPELFRGSAGKPFWSGSANNRVELWIYLYA